MKTGSQMPSVPHDWDYALQEYLLHVKATLAPKTCRFYSTQLRQMTRWAEDNGIEFGTFGKRHLDQYLVWRREGGKSAGTLHHDAVAAKAFFRWCQRNDLIARSPLADYQIRKAPRPYRYMPTQEDVKRLLDATRERWQASTNPGVRYFAPESCRP